MTDYFLASDERRITGPILHEGVDRFFVSAASIAFVLALLLSVRGLMAHLRARTGAGPG